MMQLHHVVQLIVLDNQHLGLVRQQQTLFYEGRLNASAFARSTDFVALARAFGLPASCLSDASSIASALPDLLAQRGPRLIHIPITAQDLVLPMVASGAANHEMVRIARLGSDAPRPEPAQPFVGASRPFFKPRVPKGNHACRRAADAPGGWLTMEGAENPAHLTGRPKKSLTTGAFPLA